MTTIRIKPMSATIGLLGIEVTQEDLNRGDKHLTNLRLAEIEQRILDIEAMVWPTGK